MARRCRWWACFRAAGGVCRRQRAGQCEVLITGDLSYHVAKRPPSADLRSSTCRTVDFEWWALRRWTKVRARLAGRSVAVEPSGRGVSLDECRAHRAASQPWARRRGKMRKAGPIAGARRCRRSPTRAAEVRIWIDGGSRGNPGPERDRGGGRGRDGRRARRPQPEPSGSCTNNVAEYRALLAGSARSPQRWALERSRSPPTPSCSCKQMRGEYKVKNEGLRPLYEEARERARGFSRFSIRHVEREANARADALVNKALDEQQKAGL